MKNVLDHDLGEISSTETYKDILNAMKAGKYAENTTHSESKKKNLMKELMNTTDAPVNEVSHSRALQNLRDRVNRALEDE